MTVTNSWVFLLLWMSVCLQGIASDSWPQYLGPHRDGQVAAPGLFHGDIRLEKVWSMPLGSGFSGILVHEAKVYTMHAAGEKDALSCFEAATGRKLWSYAYGKAFPKVGSSEPGPLSTPVLDEARIYGLGASGELFFVDRIKGSLVWAHNIIKEYGAIPPETGISTSPMLIENLLLVQIGDQKNKGIAAFDKKTGALMWHFGQEKVSHHSPGLLHRLNGQRELVALSDTKMRGLDASTGKVLWEHEHNGVQVIPAGTDRLLSAEFGGSSLLKHSFLGFQEQWRSRSLSLNYDMPVLYQGYVFGFEDFLLTCLNLETGAEMWQAEAPDRGMSILVDGHLVVICEDGELRVIRASPKGYDERASLQVFEQSGITAPAYADRRIYLRNYTHLIAVAVQTSK